MPNFRIHGRSKLPPISISFSLRGIIFFSDKSPCFERMTSIIGRFGPRKFLGNYTESSDGLGRPFSGKLIIEGCEWSEDN